MVLVNDFYLLRKSLLKMSHLCPWIWGKYGTCPIFTLPSRITSGLKMGQHKIFNHLMLLYAIYAWSINKLLAMQSQIWNVKHKKPKFAMWIKMEILTNQKRGFRYILDLLSITRPISNVHLFPQKDMSWGWVIKFLFPLFIRHAKVINRFPCAHLGTVNTFFLKNIEYLLITILNI